MASSKPDTPAATPVAATPAATPAGQAAANLAGEERDTSLPMSQKIPKKVSSDAMTRKIPKKVSDDRPLTKEQEAELMVKVRHFGKITAAAAAEFANMGPTDELMRRMATEVIQVPLLLDPGYDPTAGNHRDISTTVNPIFLHCLNESPAFNELRRTDVDMILRQTVAVPLLLRLLPGLDEDEWWTTGARLELAWILLAMTRSYEYGVLVPEKGPNGEWVSTFIERIAHNALNPAFIEEHAGVEGWCTNEGMLGEHRLWGLSMLYYALEKNQKWFLSMERLGICQRDEPRLAKCEPQDTRLLRNSCECWVSSVDPEGEMWEGVGDVD
jgi:hypothetical protein